MRYIRKRCMAYVAAIVLCLSAVLPAQAAQVGGTTTIAVSSSSMEVGDRLTVTVKPSADGTTLTFEAVGSGSSGLIVSSDTLTGSSTTVQVADPAATTTTEPQEGSQSQAGETTAQTGGTSAQAEGQFTIDGVAYVASERYSASEVPAGFNTVQLEIQGSTYRELSNGQITLVYLKPASNTSGSGTFYIYNEENQSVSPMILIGTMEDYVIALEPAEILADGTANEIFGDRQITAYAVSGNTDNFYYLYGIDENGTEQWYQYDADDGSMQRANTALFAADEGQTNTDAASASGGDSDQISRLRIVIAVLIFVAVVLLIAVVNLVLGRRRVRKDVYDAMEDEEESDEAEENEDDDLTYSEDADEDEEDEDDEEWQGFHGINDSVRMDLEDDMEDSRRQEEDDDHVTEELQRELDQLNLRGKEEKKRKDTSEDSGKKNKKKKETDEEEELDFSDLEILDLNDL